MDATMWVVLAAVAWFIWVFVQASGRATRKRLYNEALGALADDPANNKLRVAALKAGRAHYGGLRKGGIVTIYDEQAINNDLTAHTGDAS